MKSSNSRSVLVWMAMCWTGVCVSARAQMAYEWNAGQSAAHWNGQDLSLEVWGPSGPGTQGVDWGSSYGGNGAGGPYDGASGVVFAQNEIRGTVSTTVDAEVFDLSQSGSSATTRFVYHFADSGADATPGNLFHLFEWGLTQNITHFGGVGDESVLIGAQLKNRPHTAGASNAYDVFLFDEDSVGSAPTNGFWSAQPEATLLTDVTIAPVIRESGASSFFSPGVSSLVETTWTNEGNGKMRLDLAVTELEVDGPFAANSVTGTQDVHAASVVFDHELTDLSQLSPELGYRTAGQNVPTTGAIFDWNEAFAVYAIPEPSALFGLGVASLFFLLRRRR